jgi:hypothetical protein
MAQLTGNLVADTFKSLLKTVDNDVLSAYGKEIVDGYGNSSNILINTSGDVTINGNFRALDAILDSSGSAGSNGQVLVTTGLKTEWQSLSAVSGVSGTGTAGYITKWLDANTITNSIIIESGTTVTIGGTAVASTRLNTPILQLTGGTGTQGTFSWNTDEETVDVILNGSTLQLGQETHVHVRNSTTTAIPNGTPVYVTGTLGASGRLKVAPMIANGDIDAKYFIGVTTEEIGADEDGKVTWFGKVRGFDTTPYGEGVELYVSETVAGGWQTTRPTAPNPVLEVAFTVNDKSNGTIFVRSNNGHSLSTNNDVSLSSVADKDLLVWDSTNGYWKNSKTLGDISTGNITTSGYLRGPATFVIDPSAYDDVTGLVQILGDLRVDGVTTTVNSTTVTINDKNIVLADEAVTAADANGAGITINGAGATLTYVSATDDFHFNKNVNASTFIGALTGNVTGNVTGNLTGNASTASKWATARTITLGGDLTGNVSIDGSANVTLTAAVVNDSHTHDTRYYTETELDGGQLDNRYYTETEIDNTLIGYLTTTGKAADSDKLDNLDSTQFLRSDATDYTTGNLLIGASANPEQTLEVRGNILLGANDINQFIHSGGSMAFSADTNVMIVVDSNDTDGAAPSGEILFGAGTAINTNADRGFTYDEAYPLNAPRLLYGKFDGSGNFDITGGSLKMNGTDVINSSRNITAGTISGTTGSFSSNVSIESSASNFVGLTVGTSNTTYVRQDFKTDTIGAATAYLIAYGSTNPNDGSIAIKSNASHTTTNGTAGDIWFATGAASTERMRIKGSTGAISMTNDLSISGNLDVNGTGVTNFAGDVTVEGTFTMNGASLVYNDMTFNDSGIILATSTTATRGLIWDVGTSGFLSKIDGGGANGGMLEIYTNSDDAITTGDVFRVKEGSTAATLFSVTGNGDATISGGLNLGGNLLMDFSGTTYSDAIVFRGAASSAGEIGIRANGEAFELYEPEDVNKVWLTIADDPAANNTALQVNSTSGMVPVLHSINMPSYVTTAYIQSQGFLRDTTDTFTGTLTLNGSQTINGSGNGLTFTGGNNRIYFGAYRALEATTTSAATLQLGESYATTRLYGNVGIDKAAPDSRLHIHKEDASPVLLTLENYVADIDGDGGVHGNFIDFKTSDGNVTSQPQARIGMLVKDYTGENGISSEGDGNLVFYTNDGTDDLGNGTLSEVMRLTHQKNVGIGTDSPSYTLHAYHPTTNVVGQFQSGDNQAWISVRDNNYTTYGAMLGCDYSSGMNIILGGNGAEKLLTISNGGNVGIGLGNATADSNRMLHIKGSTTGSVKIEASGTSDTFIDFKTTNNEAFIGIDESANVLKINNTNTLGSAVHMAISTSGNVGIGTASPTKYISSTETVLHIQNSNVASINLDSTGGSGRNYVMMSTASGNWQIYDVDASSTRFTLGSSGSFGFGTTSLSGTNRIEIESTNAYDLSTGGNDTGGILIKGAVSTGDGSYTGGIGFGFGTGTAGITAKQYGSDSDRLGLSFFVHGSTTGNNPTAEKMTLDYTGSLTVGTGTEANQVRVYWDDTAEWTDYTGYGISFHRSASYLRPDVNNLKTMYFGNSSLAWAEIQQHANEHNWYNLSGSFAMRLNGSGNLGLGTSSPNGKFTTVGTYATVTHSLAANSAISISSMGVNGSGFNAFTIGQANSTNNCGVMRFGYAGAGSTSNYVGFGFYANDDILTIKPNGNVGIGTTENYTNLYIKGAAPYITIANTTEDDGGIFFTDYQAGANPLSSNSQAAAIKFNSSDNALRFYNNDAATERFRINTDGNSQFLHNVLITGYVRTGLGSASSPAVQVGDTDTGFYDSGANAIGVAMGGVQKFDFESAGIFRAAGDIIAYYSFSDARLKTNVKPLENSLEKVKQLQGVYYEWIDGERKGKTEVGLIAQEVEKVVPEVVREQKRLGDDTEYKTVDYEKMVGVLIEAIKEQQEQIDELKNELKELKSK